MTTPSSGGLAVPETRTFSAVAEVKDAGAETAFASRVLAGILQYVEPTTEAESDALKSTIDAIKDQRKRIDESRKTITAPLRAAEKAVNALLLPAIENLDAAEKHAKGLILAFVAKGRAAAVSAMQEIAAGADALAVPMPTLPAGTHTVRRWKAEVVNATAVPRVYCSPDPDKINALIEAHKHDKSAVLSIPGVRFYEEETLTVRGGK